MTTRRKKGQYCPSDGWRLGRFSRAIVNFSIGGPANAMRTQLIFVAHV
jgi:hypothetical protein